MSFDFGRLVRRAKLPASTQVAESTLKGLALLLATWANKDSGEAFPSVETLAWFLGVKDRTVQRGIRILCASGVLIELERGGRSRRPNSGRASRYRLCKERLVSLACDPPRGREGDSPVTLCGRGKGDRADAIGRHDGRERVTALSRKGDASVTRSVRDLSGDLSGELTGADAPAPPFKVYVAIAKKAWRHARTDGDDSVSNVKAWFMHLCAEEGLPYDDPDLCRRAIDAAIHVSNKRQWNANQAFQGRGR
jgi:hypothetical protein